MTAGKTPGPLGADTSFPNGILQVPGPLGGESFGTALPGGASARQAPPAAGPISQPAEPKIAWGHKVSAAFKTKIIAVAAAIGVPVDYLMAVIAFESGGTFSPTVANGAGSGAIGLIQFTKVAADELNTTEQHLSGLSAVDQLSYVEKYFMYVKNHLTSGIRLTTIEDVYMAVLFPAAIGKPNDYILFTKSDPEHPKYYLQNAGLDLNRDGKITKAEAASGVIKKLAAGRLPANLG